MDSFITSLGMDSSGEEDNSENGSEDCASNSELAPAKLLMIRHHKMRRNVLLVALCFLANFLLATKAQNCVLPESQFKDFDITQYARKWFEVRRIQNVAEKFYKCEFDEYSKTPQGIKVVSRAYNTSTSSYETSKGEIAATTTNTFTIKYTSDVTWSNTYTVLGTDYSTYSVVAGCLDTIDKLLVWIAADGPELSPAAEQNVKKTLEIYNLDLSNFESVSWTNCPEPPSNK
ncbi:hypothetical protein L9F63_009163 [Diploptera punctata]|uniref:Lipocalin/cytosolic fatty-acid binding domain-containing protein n=1 Tax=Diploptera punctata TaxID=6984 RepID=A0AAD7Z497_DIPPU|nr:hypothetical protein L9F63_009163 [Diploptera punctata]